jgi:hypothetical protein
MVTTPKAPADARTAAALNAMASYLPVVLKLVSTVCIPFGEGPSENLARS